MTDTTNDTTFDDATSIQQAQQLTALEDRVKELKTNNEELSDDLDEALLALKKYKSKIDRLQRENKKLKQSPLFVATVQDIIGEEVVIKQHGNQQEVMTKAPDDLLDAIEPQDRVAVNDSFTIVKQLTDETDVRARSMAVNESPNTTYSDVGGLDDELKEVREAAELPLSNPEMFNNVGIDPPSGILLYGPPGTGKTMIAKAVANQTNASFLSLSGSDLVKKYIGDGARLVRDLFEVAEDQSPAIVFIDEIDAIASKRVDSETRGDAEVQRTLMQLLSEMDGFEGRDDTIIIAATNRVDMLDDAILRPGRFDRQVKIAEPDLDARSEIFNIHMRGMNTSDDISEHQLAQQTDGVTGADIKAIVTEAGMFAIRNDRVEIIEEDILAALDKVVESKQDGETPYSLAFA
jgi:proteasome regulatory subunit